MVRGLFWTLTRASPRYLARETGAKWGQASSDYSAAGCLQHQEHTLVNNVQTRRNIDRIDREYLGNDKAPAKRGRSRAGGARSILAIEVDRAVVAGGADGAIDTLRGLE